jgi:hypothetical protein
MCDERLGDTREVAHRYIEWITVAIGDPIEAISQATPGSTRGIDIVHMDWLRKGSVVRQKDRWAVKLQLALMHAGKVMAGYRVSTDSGRRVVEAPSEVHAAR